MSRWLNVRSSALQLNVFLGGQLHRKFNYEVIWNFEQEVTHLNCFVVIKLNKLTNDIYIYICHPTLLRYLWWSIMLNQNSLLVLASETLFSPGRLYSGSLLRKRTGGIAVSYIHVYTTIHIHIQLAAKIPAKNLQTFISVSKTKELTSDDLQAGDGNSLEWTRTQTLVLLIPCSVISNLTQLLPLSSFKDL